MQSDHEARRQELYRLMGDLPDPDRPIGARMLQCEQRDGYVLERLVLDLNGMESVPAWFARPAGGDGPFATVLYNHYHGGQYELGKDELISGGDFSSARPYAEELTSRGYAALCIDHWCFGERRGLSEQDVFKQMLWQGRVLWGMRVYDSIRALDYLVSRPDVDTSNLGTMGLSMGSTMAWWLAALDTRVKVCIDICCLTDFEAIIESRGLSEHGVYYFVPSLLKHFTTAQINALVAPRAHLAIAGNYDLLTPPAGLDKIDAELKTVYGKLGAAGAWQLLRYETGHGETAEMRAEVLAFLSKHMPA